VVGAIAIQDDDRDAVSRVLGGFGQLRPDGDDDIDLVFDQVVRHCGTLVRFGRDAKIDVNALALNIAKRLQTFQHGLQKRVVHRIVSGGWRRQEQSDLRQALWWLRLDGVATTHSAIAARKMGDARIHVSRLLNCRDWLRHCIQSIIALNLRATNLAQVLYWRTSGTGHQATSREGGVMSASAPETDMRKIGG
jgi:hypothetical protein